MAKKPRTVADVARSAYRKAAAENGNNAGQKIMDLYTADGAGIASLHANLPLYYCDEVSDDGDLPEPRLVDIAIASELREGRNPSNMVWKVNILERGGEESDENSLEVADLTRLFVDREKAIRHNLTLRRDRLSQVIVEINKKLKGGKILAKPTIANHHDEQHPRLKETIMRILRRRRDEGIEGDGMTEKDLRRETRCKISMKDFMDVVVGMVDCEDITKSDITGGLFARR